MAGDKPLLQVSIEETYSLIAEVKFLDHEDSNTELGCTNLLVIDLM